MRRFAASCAILAAAGLIFAASAQAQGTGRSDDESEVPPGMERKVINSDVTLLMPKGGKLFKRNETTFVMESADEYASRMIDTLQKRIKALEDAYEEMRKELVNVKAVVEKEKAAA